MFQDTSDLAAMAEALSRSADYRVLRRLVPRIPSSPAVGQDIKTGILLDTETTGLDHVRDEIIELGMVKFNYLATAGSSASGTSSPPSTSPAFPSRPR
jgi:DNA polymerase-3 subunit epsilon